MILNQLQLYRRQLFQILSLKIRFDPIYVRMSDLLTHVAKPPFHVVAQLSHAWT